MADSADKIATSVVEHDEETQQPVKNNKQVDDAHRFVQVHSAIEWTEEEERKVLWKIDIRIIILLVLANIMISCDSQAFGVAAIFGLIQDLKLYTIISTNPSQYPLLVLAQRLPIGKYMTEVVMYSGALSLLFLTLNNFAGTMALRRVNISLYSTVYLMTIRFFYGFQGVGLSVCILISSMWWKTEEQPLRIELWMCGASIGAIVGQAFDYTTASINGQFEKSAWKWIYLLLGSMTVAYAIFFGIFFPDSPMTAHFLTERERNIALICVTGFFFAFATAALGSFGAIVLSGFGFSNFKTVQLYMPCSGIVIILMIVSGSMANKFRNSRIIIAMGFVIPTIVAYDPLWKLPRDNQGGLLASLYLTVFFYGALIQTFGLLASNVAGYTRKTTANAMGFMVSSIGGITGPFAFKGSEASEGYPTGMIILMVSMTAAEVAMVTLLLYYKRFNRRHDLAMQTNAAANACSQHYLKNKLHSSILPTMKILISAMFAQ
ncbi:uncharacterized protein Z519_05018 [Cladophialophora bantiana CBS 173.52]|uniref:Major facilitator superfamily (MFS) profile domain-containing protein n=1 Tax=Cladophialophora bantiana (strain ATCC 10958 / CBS 173.52 / CDC B-1940 / NIH 8579) TaxID=1442370 RepID=A0A0D2IA85_CLAB1|nr:uncharacterized protein Z519_05018 [Cladophialophora bantiana CBS 173.52]KIW93704.1 hypothetical protein Z519_05018 [Cladophialophora bantiana CBS 173.52]